MWILLFATIAMADEAPTTPRTEETVTLSEEATAPLFDRIRGAHMRAIKDGKVAATDRQEATSSQQH